MLVILQTTDTKPLNFSVVWVTLQIDLTSCIHWSFYSVSAVPAENQTLNKDKVLCPLPWRWMERLILFAHSTPSSEYQHDSPSRQYSIPCFCVSFCWVFSWALHKARLPPDQSHQYGCVYTSISVFVISFNAVGHRTSPAAERLVDRGTLAGGFNDPHL